MSKQKLGRGLEAILSPLTAGTNSQNTENIINIAIDKIKPNKYQPRLVFNEEKLKDLAESIKQKGLIEPIMVVQSVVPGEYELIAGERRLRASKLAGLTEIKAIVNKAASDKDKLDLALIENLQREDLNPIEEAKAYKLYSDKYKYTQEEISKIVNKNRAVIANTLRLLNLAEDIQDLISSGKISSGHGRMLASLDNKQDVEALAKKIIDENLTVRQVENIVSEIKTKVPKKHKNQKQQNVEITNLVEELQRLFGTKVKITGNGKKGKIILDYCNLEDLERITNSLKN